MAIQRRIPTADELQRIGDCVDLNTTEGLAIALLLVGLKPSDLLRLRRRNALWDGRGALLQAPEGAKEAGRLFRLQDRLGVPLMRHALALSEPLSVLFDLSTSQLRHAFEVASERAGVVGVSMGALRSGVAAAASSAERILAAVAGLSEPEASELARALGPRSPRSVDGYFATKTNPISDGQLSALLEAAEDDKIRAAVALIAHGGLRAGEAIELRHSNVADDGADVVLTIRGRRGRERRVTAPEPLRNILRALTGEPDEPVLGWSYSHLARVIDGLCRRTGIEANLHALRRYALTAQLSK